MPEKQKVALLANSGCDMPPDKAAAIGFTLIPDVIIFEEQQYRNNIEIDCPNFYKMLEGSRVLPTSSHPSIGDFMAAFEEAAVDCDEILCMTVTARMSGTYSTAMAAKRLLEEQGFERPIHVYNSQQVSHGMALMMAEASALRMQGMGAEEIMLRLDQAQKKIGVYFVLESLKNARKGGRVGAIKALAADALGVKPLLTFGDGTVRDIGIARSFKEGMEGVLKRYREEADFSADCAVFHADNLPEAQALAAKIRALAPEIRIEIEYVGAVIGIYTGRGCVGAAFRRRI